MSTDMHIEVYFLLFILFVILSNFLNSKSINLIPIKIRLILQAIIIIIFFIGVNKVIHIGNKECSQNIIRTAGTINCAYTHSLEVRFKNCNGYNSYSNINISEKKLYTKYGSITIYYSQEGLIDDTRESFSYQAFLSKADFLEKSEMPIRKKVAIFMLLLWLYFVLNYKKKLTLPSSYNKSTYLKIDPYNEKSYEFLSKLNPHEYNTENYDTMYLIYTDSSDKINIKRTDIFSLLLPAVISTALLWMLLHLVFKEDIPSDEVAGIYASIATIFVFFLISFYFTVKNLNAIKHIGIFDYSTKQYKANDYNKTISFNDIYGYTIIFKTIKTKIEANLSEDIQERTFIERLYILDLILSNGEVLNLMANENKNTLLAQAKIISAYTQKPIFDLGKWNYFDLKNIYLDTLTKKSD